MNREELNTALYEKMAAEQNTFRDWLKSQGAEVVLDHAYEYSVREDIVMDELPELFNILKGDMSLVGPRPLLAEYLPRYNAHQARRHEVRPGLTGLAQISGRNSLSWEERFEDDVRYVDKITFLGDLGILLNTVKTVVRQEGISSGTSVTMEAFLGSEESRQ